jgi:hypothetical protein
MIKSTARGVSEPLTASSQFKDFPFAQKRIKKKIGAEKRNTFQTAKGPGREIRRLRGALKSSPSTKEALLSIACV